jgi:hypothetical protein
VPRPAVGGVLQRVSFGSTARAVTGSRQCLPDSVQYADYALARQILSGERLEALDSLVKDRCRHPEAIALPTIARVLPQWIMPEDRYDPCGGGRHGGLSASRLSRAPPCSWHSRRVLRAWHVAARRGEMW